MIKNKSSQEWDGGVARVITQGPKGPESTLVFLRAKKPTEGFEWKSNDDST